MFELKFQKPIRIVCNNNLTIKTENRVKKYFKKVLTNFIMSLIDERVFKYIEFEKEKTENTLKLNMKEIEKLRTKLNDIQDTYETYDLSEFEENIKDLTSRLDDVDDEIKEFTRSVEKIDADEIERTLESLESKIDDIESNTDDCNTKIGEMESKIETIESNTDNIDKRLNETSLENFNTLSEKIDIVCELANQHDVTIRKLNAPDSHADLQRWVEDVEDECRENRRLITNIESIFTMANTIVVEVNNKQKSEAE
jgi:chromosome segregation ATPase